MSQRVLTCVPLDEDPASLVRRHLAEPRNGWSVGTYGALGEFEYDLDEPDLAIDLDVLSVRSLSLYPRAKEEPSSAAGRSNDHAH